jgi:thiamine pyrophosphate-dependent acetolactate synthase large subunit-like protein
MNITHILLNNNELGKIFKRTTRCKNAGMEDLNSNPNFAEYAIVYSGFYIRITKNEELEEVVIKALNYSGAAIVEIMADPLLT